MYVSGLPLLLVHLLVGSYVLLALFDAQDSERRSPLHAAAHVGDNECVSLLILNGRY